MIPPRLAAILWLKWRLALNQLRRRTPLGGVVTLLVLIMAAVTALLAFVIPLAIGISQFPEARPADLLLVWDVVVGAFLFFWIIGVVTELQRSESLSLDKLLHLPVSLRGAFLLNYASSFLTYSLVFFVPAMLALALALVIVEGPRMLIVFPLVLSFLLMATAVTFQFRGWLASIMANKRRRGTVIAIVTVIFILLMQLPQLFFWIRHDTTDVIVSRSQELQRQHEAGEIDSEQYTIALNELTQDTEVARQEGERRTFERMLRINLILPPGWLPYGTRAAARGDIVPGALGALGAFGIAVISLTLSYRTTVRLYTGGGRRRRRAKTKKTERNSKKRTLLVERTIPGCPDQVSAIAFAGFRSLTRSPQAKLLLLTPVIVLVLFGSMLAVNREREPPEQLPPLLAVGTIALAMFCIVQLLQNIFGFDRDGFRALVLAPVSRRLVLLGKNLSIAPVAIAIGGIGLVALQFVFPLRFTHLVASVLQLASIFLICCMVGNVISILAPMAMSATTLKAAHPTAATVFKQVVYAFLFPIAMLPTLVPLGIELLLEVFGRRAGIPVYLSLSAVELLGLIWLYGRVLRAEGRLLQRRERHILDEVTRQAA